MMKEGDLFIRYARQIALEEIGIEGQNKLKSSRVLVIGCGALGSLIAMQLAGAGIGTIGIADFDTIDISNLQRQFFFKEKEGGQSKAKVLEKRLLELNPDVKVIVIEALVTSEKAKEIIPNYDFIIDAADNPETTSIIERISGDKKKVCCLGGINGFSGQVTTLFPEDERFGEYFGREQSEGLLPCSIGGVFGPAATLCASLQASEAIKYLTGAGELLRKKILFFDLLKNNFKTISF